MKKLVQLALVISFFLHSCVKEKYDSSKLAGSASFSPGIAVPIGYAHMTLQKYLNDSTLNKYINIDPTGFITLVYHQKVFSLPALSAFQFPDRNFNFNIYQPAKKKKAFNLEVSDTAYFQIIQQSAGGMRLDSLILSSGMIGLTINNNLNLQGTYSITFPGIMNKGKALQIQNDLSQTTPAPLDLSAYTIQCATHNDSSNFFTAIIDLNITSGGIVNPGSQLLGIDFTLHAIQYSVFYGYAGEISIPINNGNIASFPLNFYNRLLGGNFYFSNPKIKVLFTNSFGVPFEIFFTDIHAATNSNGSIIVSGVPGAASPKAISYPIMPFAEAKDSIVLDTINSNIGYILEEVPTQMTFHVVDSINPSGLPAHQNFVTNSSILEADLQIELPLQGRTYPLLILEDTLKFEFASFVYTNIQEVKSIDFRLSIKNGFPFEIIPQLYFTDDQFHPLDSLVINANTNKILAAPIDANGIVNNTSFSTLDFTFLPSRIQNIQHASHIVTRGRIKSSSFPKDIKILNKAIYALDFNIGVIIQLQVNTNL